MSVVIPDRDAPALLEVALASLYVAHALLPEPLQVIIVTNGAPKDRYAGLANRYPDITWIHLADPAGFSTAIDAGLARAMHDWTLLLNNDVELERDSLRALANERQSGVFGVAAQIHQRSADGRREETGFTDWYVEASGIRAFHAPIDVEPAVKAHLAASGGAALFRTDLLQRYVKDARAYDPFYWEDIEWSLRAQRNGLRVLFCPSAHAGHRHRATTARFYPASEIERVVERNRILFDARNAVTRNGSAWLLGRVCDLDYRSQRELSSARIAFGIFRQRREARRGAGPLPPILTDPGRRTVDVTPSFSFSLRPRGPRPCLLVVTPFCIYPARHGGARRVEALLRVIRRDHDVILLSDEASLYDSRSLAHFDGLHGVTLVRREDAGRNGDVDLAARMRSHAHEAMRSALRKTLDRYQPDIVQIEHAELASLSALRSPRECWILALHDAFRSTDFRDAVDAQRIEQHVRETYDAVTVCSREDQALISHAAVHCVPNGADPVQPYRRSPDGRLLFMGPFRYAPNLDGIRRFLAGAWPAIRQAVPDARILVLGGDGAPTLAAQDALFMQPGVDVLGHREDVQELLADASLSVNPLAGIRGSSVKLIESLMAGRVCVSTAQGARGFTDAGMEALLIVPEVEAIAQPVIELLKSSERRHRIERPDPAKLACYAWAHAAETQARIYRQLLDSRD